MFWNNSCPFHKLFAINQEELAGFDRFILEKKATGVFHGVDGSPLQYVLVARTVSQTAGMNGDVQSWQLDDARKVMGPFADALALNQEVKATRALGLGWKPGRLTFLRAAAEAFEEWKA